MEGRENLEVKEFIIDYASSNLDGCSLFSDTFGEGFAKKRLSKNIKKVYTNAKSQNRAGICDIDKESITIYKGEEEGLILTVEDVKSDKELSETSGHEAVHAVLRRTQKECEEQNIKMGTGMLEIYHDGTELGRGLNEGLTNWIWGKTGNKTTTYHILTGRIELLELAIGQENVMQFGKGNIRQNIADKLKMTEIDTVNIIGIGDDIYRYERRKEQLKRIIAALKNRTRDDEPSKFLDKQELMQELSGDYGAYFTLLHQNEAPINGTIEDQINYFLNLSSYQDKFLQKYMAEFNEIVVSKYFTHEMENLRSVSGIGLKTMERLDRINFLLGNIREKDMGPQVKEFKKFYSEMEQQVFDGVVDMAKKDLKEGRLTGKRIAELERLTNRGRLGKEPIYVADRRFIDEIAGIVNPKKREAVSELLCNLISKGEVEDASEYEIETINTGEKKVYLYKKSGEVVSIFDDYYMGQLESSNNEEEMFQFTVELNENMQDIIASFNKLSDSVLSKDSDADIKILNRLISIHTRNEDQYYYIQHNNIVRVKKERRKSENVNVASEKENALVVQNNGILDRIQRAIRAKFDNIRKNISGQGHENIEANIRKRENEFKVYISDMSNYAKRDDNTNLPYSGEKQFDREADKEYDEEI